MRRLIDRFGQIKLTILVTLVAILLAEILAWGLSQIFFLGYPAPSAPLLTLLVTAVVTPLLAWHVLKYLLYIERMEQEMHHMATYDPLTHFYTRQAFFIQVQQRYQHAPSYAVAFIDVDDFKSINDTYGHAYGDKVLIDIGKRFMQTLGEDCLIGRIGGEEFALVTETDAASMRGQMEILRHAVAHSKIPYRTTPFGYTISIGIFENKSPDTLTIDDALSRADQALYRAKELGKNRTIVYTESLSNSASAQHSAQFRSSTTPQSPVTN